VTQSIVAVPDPQTALSAAGGTRLNLLHERSKRGVAGEVPSEEVGGKLWIRHLKEPSEIPRARGTRRDLPAVRINAQSSTSKLLHAPPAAPTGAAAARRRQLRSPS